MTSLKIKFMVWVISALIYVIRNQPFVLVPDTEYLVKQGTDLIDELVNFDGGEQ
jgi:hypothetical protein